MGAEAPPDIRNPLLGARPASDDERRRERWSAICCDILLYALWSLIILYVVGMVASLIFAASTNGALEYSAAITGVAGLDPAMDLRSDLRRTLSPVLNLTIDIKEFDIFLDYACIGGWWTDLTVSYGGAVLGRGAVPWFCVLPMLEDAVAVQARGVDVVVPRFLRERLAGELERGEGVLDVTLLDPMVYGSVLACKVKIGGGLCPCKLPPNWSED